MTNRGIEEYSARFVPVLSKSFLVSYFFRRQRRWILYEAAACKIASHFALQLSIICGLQINSQCGRNFKWSYCHNETLHTVSLYSEANHRGPWNHRLVHFVSIVKPTRCTIFSSLLNIVLHVSDGLPVHHQESKTVHTASDRCHTGSLTAC